VSEHALEYSIATSWDDALLHDLTALNGKANGARIGEIYGSHRITPIGSGRPTYRLPDVSAEAFTRHLALARKLGFGFNYVLNAPSFDGRERSTEWLREIAGFIEGLVAAGVERVTIANPTLLGFVRERFPALRISVSLIAGVDTPDAARRFEDMGADLIVLSPFTVNRDFATLRAIRAAVGCQLELYANIPCLDRCSMRDAHYRYSGRASQADVKTDVTYDPFLLKCSLAYLSDPVNLLRSPFIRPEDIEAYGEIGINVIKLSDRTESSAFLLETAGAYLAGHYDGDLFHLVFRAGRKFRAGLGRNASTIADLALPVRIDNARLSALNFIEHIRDVPEAALTDFYEYATREAVSVPDEGTLSRWRTVLAANPIAADLSR
jgi:collagenase-like PrtC family protease